MTETTEPTTPALSPPDTPFDPIQMFIDGRCDLVTDGYVAVADLYAAYKEWCGSMGYLFEPVRVLSQSVKAKGFKLGKKRDARSVFGLQLKSSAVVSQTDGHTELSLMEER